MLKINGEDCEVTKAIIYETTEKSTIVWNDKNPKMEKTKFLTLLRLIVDFKSKEKINDKYINGEFSLDIMNTSFDNINSLIGKKIKVLYNEEEDDIEIVDDIENFELSSDTFSYYDGWHHDYLPGDIYLTFTEKIDNNIFIELHIDDSEKDKTFIDYKDYVKIND
ncbi:MAG: hypothetical protein IKF91_04275 [Bacilli bacterium]|nr:hypothetical protein [Bacilli bacterium]